MNKNCCSVKTIKEAIKNFIPYTYVLSIYIISILYGIINKPNGGAKNLVTYFDRNTPFVKEFIIAYVSWYFFIYLTFIYLCYKDKNTYYTTLIAYNIGLLICFSIFLLFQTTVPRPSISGDDIFVKLVSTIYTNDKPYNCFPSIHCMTSYLMIRAVYWSKDKNGNHNKVDFIIALIWGTLIMISTLFVKQHVVLDIISAIAVGELLYRIFISSKVSILNRVIKRKLYN